ncbi:MAG: discoidin domain-containing protein, partial [Anaerohalosphaera sp.]|nr:discoidin domain-containing protein [Anaerohalosphaera sp.]
MRKLFLFSILFLAMAGMSMAANLALDGTVTATSTAHGWVPENAIDGNTGTGWHSDEADSHASLTLDIGGAFDLSRIELQNRGGFLDRANGIIVTVEDASHNIIATSDPISGSPA